MTFSTPKTWAYKETLSSSDMNTYVRDNINALRDGSGIADNAILAKHTEELIKAVNRQDISAAGNSVFTDPIMQVGWGFIAGDGANRGLISGRTFPVEV